VASNPLPVLSLPLVTERLAVRRFARDDAAERFRVFSDAALQQFFGHPASREDSDRQLTSDLNGYGVLRVSLAVCERASAAMIGVAVFQPWLGECEFVVGLVKASRHEGLGSELARAMLKAAFHDETCGRIVVRIARDNLESLRLVEHLGMKENGTSHDSWLEGRDRRFEISRDGA
jgi:RimJ/RimL family protein N-acetyltransferase